MKKILYIDMDDVLVDFESAYEGMDPEKVEELKATKDVDNTPDLYSRMKPMKGAIEAFNELAKVYDVYLLSTAPWRNPSSWSDKLRWVQKYLPENGEKRLILTHHKYLNKGDILIDDRLKNGEKFEGEFIHFGSEKYPDWNVVKKDLLNRV